MNNHISANFVLVMLGAIPGVLVRYFISLLFPTGSGIPIGTLVANILGSFILGFVFALFRIGIVRVEIITLVGIGFCGSVTTMSTFAFESINLLENSLTLFIINVLGTLILVLLGALFGRTSAQYYYLKRVN